MTDPDVDTGVTEPVADADRPRRTLALAVARTELSLEQLWLRYFTLGGTADLLEVEAYLQGLMPLPAVQRDVLAHAVNERLDELTGALRIPYSRQVGQPRPTEGPLAALLRLLEDTRHALAGEIPAVAAAAGSALGVEVTVHVVDYEQTRLVGLSRSGQPSPEPLTLEGTLAGRAFRLTEIVAAYSSPRPTLWVPLLDGAERLGVLEVGLTEAADLRDPRLREQCGWLAHLLAHLVAAADQHSDGIDRARRRRPRSASSQLLWCLLPPLTGTTGRFSISALIEPAHNAGGDAFDYALAEDRVDFAIFDAMGHGLEAGLIAATSLSAYRAARRAGGGVTAQAEAIDEAVRTHFPDGFATGVLGELDLDTGRLRYLCAGHPAPMLVRDGHVVATLDDGHRAPLGLGGGAVAVGEVVLQPRDCLALYTDGVTEARDASGDFFGQRRLVDFLEREAAAGHRPAETIRRLVHAVLAHQQDVLQDDATVLLMQWATEDPLPPTPGVEDSDDVARPMPTPT